jgi:hypothetical protein
MVLQKGVDGKIRKIFFAGAEAMEEEDWRIVV